MHGVVFEHVGCVFNRAEVVDAYDFDIIAESVLETKRPIRPKPLL